MTNRKDYTLDDYQTDARSFAFYPTGGLNAGITYAVLGLSSEVGELAGILKKVNRDNNGVIDSDTLEEMAKELGDVLWYTSQVAEELGYDLSEIAILNTMKLTSRQKRGALRGSGDDR